MPCKPIHRFSTPSALAAALLMAALLTGCGTLAPEPLAEMTPIEATVAPPAATVTLPTQPSSEESATPPPVLEPTTPVTTAVPSTPAAATPAVDTGEVPSIQPDTGAAVVEAVDVRILESFPVQVHAVVTGYLPDGCTTIVTTEAVQEDNTFHIVITTERPEDAICTMAIARFEEVVPLATADLPAGEYQVMVNDLTATFSLPEGNSASSSDAAQGQTEQLAVETTTEYVQAQADVPILDAPTAGANTIGLIAGGQVARVTGASADGAWWRVICPDDSVGDCWVSAEPTLTVPTTLPQ